MDGAFKFLLRQLRGYARGEDCDHNDGYDHPANGHETAEQRRWRILSCSRLRHRDSGPPKSRAETFHPALEMIGLTALEQPDHEADGERDTDQDQHSLKKVWREKIRETENSLLSPEEAAMPRPVRRTVA